MISNTLYPILKRRYINVFLIIGPLLIGGLIFGLFIYKKPLTIFPRYELFEPAVYCDSYDLGGNTTVDKYEALTDKIHLDHTLREGYEYPFVGINFGRTIVTEKFLNFIPYSELRLKLETNETVSVIVTFQCYADGITVPGDYLSYLVMTSKIRVVPDKADYTIQIKDLQIPVWWLDYHNRTLDDFKDNYLKQTNSIDISNSDKSTFDKKVSLTFFEITAVKSLFPGLPILVFVLAAYYVFLCIVFIVTFRKKKEPLLIESGPDYKPVIISATVSHDDSGIVETYINEHYMDMDISVDIISEKTGVPRYKIPQLIKSSQNMTVPAYINSLRITEARRLLTETKLSVIDIAMSVGYKNVSYFNRIFKSETGISPVKFRSGGESPNG